MIDLDEIEKRANAATAGPWEDDKGLRIWRANPLTYIASVKHQPPHDGSLYDGPAFLDASDDAYANAAFIEHARTDVPALIAEVRRLRQSLNTIAQATNEPSIKAIAEEVLK